MFKQTKIETPMLTPELVTWFRSLPNLEGDRDQTTTQGRQRIAWLARLCQDGEFYSPDWAVALWNGQQYRVNGGHSSAMLANADGSGFPRHLPVILRRFQCDSYRDVVELFNHFDNRKSIRTASDKSKVHKSVHQELSRIAPSYINRMLTGIQCFYADGCTTHGDEDERTKLIHQETDFLAWAGRFVRTRHLGRSGVIACMYRTFHADRELANTFWDTVLAENAPSPSHATRVLATFLRGLDVPPNKGRWDTRAVYIKCIHAWNAWQTDTATDLKYYPAAGVPNLLIRTGGRNDTF